MMIRMAMAVVLTAAVCTAALADPPKLTVGDHNELLLDGKRFLPIAVWAQPEDMFAMWKDLGINWFVTGSNPRREGTVAGYLKGAEENDVFVSLGSQWAKDEGLLDVVMKHPKVLTMHQPDEPDKPLMGSDAVVEPVGKLNINRRRPLLFMCDGNKSSSAVIDPLKDASFVFKLSEPATAVKVAFTGKAKTGEPFPKRVAFLADGKQILEAPLEFVSTRQAFDLDQPATFREFTVKVLELYPTEKIYGAVNEIEALDADGGNVLLKPARVVPNRPPAQIAEGYRTIKEADPARLVSLTIMARFMKELNLQRVSDEVYRQYPPACDILMFDLYPISIWRKHLHWNASGLKQLRELAGPKKVLGIWLQASDAMNAKDPGMTPRQMRANVWMCLAAGATYIGYFPQTFNPKFKFHTINQERRDALKAVNREVTELTDLILAPPRDDLFTVEHEGSRVDVLQRAEGGKALLALVHVMESDEGAPAHENLPPVKVTVRPKAFQPAGAAVRRSTGEKLAAGADGSFTVDLAPWETAVLLFQTGE